MRMANVLSPRSTRKSLNGDETDPVALRMKNISSAHSSS